MTYLISNKPTMMSSEPTARYANTPESEPRLTEHMSACFQNLESGPTGRHFIGEVQSETTTAERSAKGSDYSVRVWRLDYAMENKRVAQSISGMVTRVERGMACVEFEKSGHSIARLVSVEALLDSGADVVQPGDKIKIFVSRKSELEVTSKLVYLGPSVSELSDAECEELDRMRDEADRRGR